MTSYASNRNEKARFIKSKVIISCKRARAQSMGADEPSSTSILSKKLSSSMVARMVG
jgi:hypothetical protein